MQTPNSDSLDSLVPAAARSPELTIRLQEMISDLVWVVVAGWEDGLAANPDNEALNATGWRSMGYQEGLDLAMNHRLTHVK